MKITKQFAKQFADEWITAWNNGDIEAIMRHYADDVIFSSPFILKNQINNKGYNTQPIYELHITNAIF